MKTRNKMIFKKSRQKFPKAVGVMMLFAGLLGLQSCNDFLDVVPDNVATLDQAFTLRNEAEKYLFTCYSYLPVNGDPVYNIGLLAGDEMWIPAKDVAYTSFAHRIASGLQRTSEPYMNVWDGNYQGAGYGDNFKMWAGIRHCNVFIENLEDRTKVSDISEDERVKWIAEAKFLKAYYHFYLMNLYGPIPIMDKAIAVDAPLDELYVSRQPIDVVVNYIVQLLDDAIKDLDKSIVDKKNDLGRITKPIAASVKAQVLLTAASPLFNGNNEPPYNTFKTKDGVDFFNQTYDNEKWKLAADAALEAIALAGDAGHTFNVFTATPGLSQRTKDKLSIVGAVTERASKEVIWHNIKSDTYWIQINSAWPVSSLQNDNEARKTLSVTMKMAELFYTKNGVPIDEDNTLDFSSPTDLRVSEGSEGSDIKLGDETARLNFDRELRFYADLAFDRSVNYFESSGTSENVSVLEGKFNDFAGNNDVRDFNVTGYYPKKLVNYRYTFTSGGGTSYTGYYWPEIRLPELYLIYAEALNEYSGPSQPVYDYIDIVRQRAGLQGVQSSWSAYAKPEFKSKPSTKEGLREIIQRERTIELAFEGKRFWDLRRWKKANEEFNKPVRGWNYKGTTVQTYYQINTLFQQRFIASRDYFWPLSEQTLRQNPNLVQNPGW